MTDVRDTRSFTENSYRLHADHWKKIASRDEWQRISRSWLVESTADFWRHRRMYEAADYLRHFDGASWLTIGDGQFGLDSVRLRKRGIGSVVATDIAEAMLKQAKDQGIISDYKVENAERLSFPDESFDFAFCKESYHHFPRPYLALYEMLRVSRKGVVLIEPQDQAGMAAKRVLYWARKLLGRQRHFDERRYEDSGNYVYSISRREMTKVCLGLNLPCLAFKGLSDVYLPGVEFEPASLLSAKYLTMRALVLANNSLTALGLSRHNVLMCCLFKTELPAPVRAGFLKHRWRVVDLPRNPYAGATELEPRPPC